MTVDLACNLASCFIEDKQEAKLQVLVRICTVYHNSLCFTSTQVPVTQLDRVSDYGSES